MTPFKVLKIAHDGSQWSCGGITLNGIKIDFDRTALIFNVSDRLIVEADLDGNIVVCIEPR